MNKASVPSHARLAPDVRREQLIAAAIKAISIHGLSNVTLNKVGDAAGLTASMVNFHFHNKQALLTATLKHVAREYTDACEVAIADAGDDPSAALMGLIAASFNPEICEPGRVSLWYAFWSESRTRQDYMDICGQSDTAFYESIHTMISQLAIRTNSTIDVHAATLGLTGMVDALWQNMLAVPDTFNRASAIEVCRNYLMNLLPGFAAEPALELAPDKAGENTHELPRTLPAWTYCSQSFFDKEMQSIHKPAWHIVCHVNDVPDNGDYTTFEGLGERAFVMRGEDGVLRAFHNVCPHRAHAVLKGERGSCKGIIRCPYHSWGFGHDGELKAIAAQKTFPPFDNGEFGLKPLELEVFLGLVFIRFIPGGESVAERYGVYMDEMKPYGFEDMVPIAPIYDEVLKADWKNVWDNYLEDYHFPTGHPGLFGLMTPDYDREPNDKTRTVRLSHAMREKTKGGWSAERYASLLPEMTHLPQNQRRRWSYFFMYPSVSLDVYPDTMDFFHVVPTAPGECRLRVGIYGKPNPSRELKAAQFLSSRIAWQVHSEDIALIESVQGGLSTSGYRTGLLGQKEIAAHALQRWVGEDMPEIQS